MTGVASFGHVSGVHYQNLPDWEPYLSSLEVGELPLGRGMRPSRHQLLVRELILQLKTGRILASYFQNKFGTNILDEWSTAWQQLKGDGYVEVDGDQITLTREGLLRADALLALFFEPEYQGVRYT